MPFTSGAVSPQPIDIDFTGTTQFGSPFAVNNLGQDGYTTGRLAGVDIDAGNALVEAIKPMVRATQRSGADGTIGGFGGLYSLNLSHMERPVLVSSTDGVGTKLKIAFMMDKHDSVGIDLVAMCVNDIAVQGAKPLFFLDYLATGKLSPEKAVEIVKGIAEGCKQSNCALLGGETAEMPGVYAPDAFDLVGTVVGCVERDAVVDGTAAAAGA